MESPNICSYAIRSQDVRSTFQKQMICMADSSISSYQQKNCVSNKGWSQKNEAAWNFEML